MDDPSQEPRPVPICIDEEIIPVLTLLQHVHTYGMRTKSDLAREHADTVAEAASKGLISTAVIPGSRLHGRLWKITVRGLQVLTACAGMIEAEEVKAYRSRYATSQGVDAQ